MLRLPIDEGSAKVRDLGVIDDEPDLDLPVWAGVVPLELVAGAPQQDPLQLAASDEALRSLEPPNVSPR